MAVSPHHILPVTAWHGRRIGAQVTSVLADLNSRKSVKSFITLNKN
jgi:hypothetical protein